MTKKRLLISAAVTIVVIGGGVLIFRPKKPVISYDTAKVERGNVVQTVQATGSVASSQDVALQFEVPGRLQAIPVQVGAEVKAGTVLASLDDRDAASSVQRTQAAVLAAQAGLDKLMHGATTEDIKVSQAAVVTAQAGLDAANQSLADLKASDAAGLAKTHADLSGALETLFLKSSAAVQTLTNDVYTSNGNLRNDFSPTNASLALQATAAFKSGQQAFVQMTTDIVHARAAADDTALDAAAGTIIGEAGTIRDATQLSNTMLQSSVIASSTTQADLDGRKSAVQATWADLVAAVNAASSQRQNLTSAASSDQAGEHAAQAKVQASADALTSAQASLNLKTAPATGDDLENARAAVAQARATANAALVALEKTHLIAPFDGTISQVIGKVGLAVSPAEAIVRLHGTGAYEVEADVPETDVSKLAVGMDATVTLDAYGSDKSFPAKLSSIDSAQTVIQDIVYYKTRFQLVTPDVPVRIGMTANVNVIAAHKDGVLVVPLRAVRTGDSGKSVRVLRQGAVTDVPVTIGLRGDNNRVEALSGLSENDEVVLAVLQDGKIQ